MNIQAILFDLDGVLVDTEGIYSDFWSEMDALYPTGTPDFAQVIKGSTLPKILDTYFPDPKVQQAVRQRLDEQERGMEYRLFDGVLTMLQNLRDSGVRTAIVTSSNMPKMNHLFESHPRLRELIDTLITDEDVTVSKPDPQGYLLAASRLGVEPQNCVVVEDSMAGIEAGKRAGAAVVGVASTCGRQAVEAVAHVTVDAIRELNLNFLRNTFVL